MKTKCLHENTIAADVEFMEYVWCNPVDRQLLQSRCSLYPVWPFIDKQGTFKST